MTILVNTISDPKKLLQIEDRLNALIKEHGESPFFLSGFVKQFMEYYRLKGWTPLVLVMSANEMIVGIAPLMTRKKFGIRVVKFLLESWFSPDFVIDDRYRETSITCILDILFRALRSQFVDLTLPLESRNLQILKQACKTNKIHFSAKYGGWADMGHSVIPVKSRWDDFMKLRGWNFRRRFKRLKRNLDMTGAWRIIKTENKSIVDHVRKIFAVEKMSWKNALRTNEESDQDLLMILKGSQHTARFGHGFKCNVWFLELEDRTLAYTLVLQYKETAFIVKTSYDERYKRLYPGIYVNNEAIRDLFNNGQIRKIDWLTDLPFHRNWTSLRLPRVRVMMSRRSVLSTMIGYALTSEYTRDILQGFLAPLLTKVPFVDYLSDL